MRGNGARRALLVALTVCLAVLVLSFARRSVEGEMKRESLYPRQNTSLTMELDKDGILRIEGEGKLYADDMDALMKDNGIRSKAVQNVVIGDGITEIGYDTLAGRKYLVTLKLGKDVRRIAPGAIKSCAKLQYIYIPSGLERAGGDFLYDCKGCTVVTDGAAEELPDMGHVKSKAILDRVDSYEALQNASEDGGLPAALKHWWP